MLIELGWYVHCLKFNGAQYMKKQALATCCSTLVLTWVVNTVAVADASSNTDVTGRPYYVTAKDEDDTNTPLLSPPQDTKGTPYRLSHSLGLSPDSRIQIDGFMSAGVAHMDSTQEYTLPDQGIVGDNYNFSVLSVLGLQVTANLMKNLSIVGQVVATGNNANGNTPYSVNLDYGYVRYVISNVEMRVGRLRWPVFLYSTTQEIGYTYPWITLPNEVYGIVPFYNINGFDTIYKQSFGNSGWSTTIEPYIGSNWSQFNYYNTQITSDDINVPVANYTENSVIGGVASIGNQYVTLRGTYAHLSLTGKVDAAQTGQTTTFIDNQSDSFYSLASQFFYRGLILEGEFAHRNTPVPLAQLGGFYAMLGYKVSGFLPNLTYGRMWTDNTNALEQASGSEATELPQKQESLTLGLDYYLNNNIVFKGSIGDVRPLGGTRGFFDTVDPSSLHRNNWLYMVSVDAIF